MIFIRRIVLLIIRCLAVLVYIQMLGAHHLAGDISARQRYRTEYTLRLEFLLLRGPTGSRDTVLGSLLQGSEPVKK